MVIVMLNGRLELVATPAVYTVVALLGLYIPAATYLLVESFSEYVPIVGVTFKKLMERLMSSRSVAVALAEPVILNDFNPDPKSVILATAFTSNVCNVPLTFASMK